MKKTSFGSRFKEERKRLGLRQTDLADKAKISTRAITGFETDEYGPSVDTFRALALAGFDILYLIMGVRLFPEQLDMIRKETGKEVSRDEIVSEIHYLLEKLR